MSKCFMFWGNKSRKTVPESSRASDIGAKDLLSALITFLRPVIHGHAASPASNKPYSQCYHTEAELINGPEGKNLLSALTVFVTAAMNSPLEVHRKQDILPARDAVAFNHKMNGAAAATLEIPKEIPRSELEIKVLNAARAHVFNRMPICLLAFDKDGCNIQLIGRNQIFSQVLPGVFAKIAEPEFQSAWAYAETLEDSELVMLSAQRRSNTMKELLASVVEKSVDYAILSHTWMRDTPGDVTFKDWATREGNPRGNAKIVKFCQVTARDHNITLGWIDSVCINKDSSSELDE